MDILRSPLAPSAIANPPLVGGMEAHVLASGIRYRGRDDLLLIRFPEGASVAGVFTSSSVPSAPVQWCRAVLPRDRAHGLVVNAGNANACTGAEGEALLRATVERLAAAWGCKPESVLVASTGVIGELMPLSPWIDAVTRALHAPSITDALPAASAIMTTDTFAKTAERTLWLHDGGACAQPDAPGAKPVRLVGIAKGSGMVAPNMATMLAFVWTDAIIDSADLQRALVSSVDRTFNCITVDGDMSTSDTVLAFATGASGCSVHVEYAEHAEHAERREQRHDATRERQQACPSVGEAGGFAEGLRGLLEDLAIQVVRDGEGATKLVTIDVVGAATEEDAKAVASAIANSPLVKTAISGEDANWGRIMMAIGKSGARVQADQVSIDICGHPVAKEGRLVSGYDEGPIASAMKGQDIQLSVGLGLGKASARMWTCDFSDRYIAINADYRS